MTIQLYNMVTDGRRTGIVTRIQGGLAEVSYPTKVPEAWAHLARSYETVPLMDLRRMDPPVRLAA